MAGPVHDPALYRERDAIPVRRALISVSDKTGLLELAAALAGAGVEIVSTGSTAATIAEAGHAVTEVSAVTGFAETLDGRVKTLHPSVHAGILADLRLESHEAQLAELGIAPFDLVIVNLYPFVETVASGAEASAIVEQIDIGGPAMVRAAAKNHANVAIIVDPGDYHQVTKAVTLGGTTLLQRQRFAAKAFAHTAAYDTAVAGWFAENLGVRGSHPAGDGSPATVEVHARLQQVLRYGENSHQSAALYRTDGGAGIAQATQLHGKEMSYNNYVDADAAVRAAFDHEAPAVAIIKHANPCGIAVGASIAEAHAAAHACDPVSAFGGVIAANRVVTLAAAESIAPIFTEVVVAPGFEPEARALLSEKKNIRLLELPTGFTLPAVELRQVSGGLLRQEADHAFAPASTWQLAAGEPRRRGDPRRPRVRLARVPRREVERHSAGVGRSIRRRRHGAGQPGRLVPPRGVARRRPGPRVGRRLRRVLPLRRRAAGAARRGSARDRAAGRLGARRGGRRGGAGRRGHDVSHGRAPLLPLTVRARARSR